MNFGAQSIEECGNSRVNHLCTWPCMKIEEGEEKKRMTSLCHALGHEHDESLFTREKASYDRGGLIGRDPPVSHGHNGDAGV